MSIRNLCLLVLVVTILGACSLQKRRYNSGYYVQWHGNKSTHEPLKAGDRVVNTGAHHAASVQQIATPSHEELSASVEQAIEKQSLLRPTSMFLAPEDTCDILIFKDGSEVKAKILEVGVNDIKYKRCSNLDGPNHISRKSEIFMIKYANGTKEVIRSQDPEPIRTYQSPKPVKTNSYARNNRQNHPLAFPALICGIGSIMSAYLILILLTAAFNAFIILVIPVLLGLAAFILGKIALSEIKEHPETWKGKGMAIPGLIMGAIMAAICALILFLFLTFA